MTTTTKTAEERMSHVKPDNFILVQGRMLTELGLKGNDLLVYAIINGFSQDGESCFHGSLQYLADWTGSTKKGVQKNLKSLIAKGLITKSEKVVNGVKYCEYRATARKTGGYGTQFPGMELSSPGMELSSPGMELSSPGMELSSPGMELSSPGMELSSPGMELSSPGMELSSPGMELSSPGMELSSPGMELSSPGMELSSPGMELSSPGMELSSPGMELSSPGMELSSPGMELSSTNNIEDTTANNKKENTGTYEPDDDDLPFANDASDKEHIKEGLVQVAAEWNRITKILKGEGIQASSLVLSQMQETSDRTRKLRLTVRDYGADVIIKCLRAYEQDDWWTGRTTKPQYAGKARDIVYVLDHFDKLLRLADEMGLIEAADTTGGLRYRPAEQSADVSPDQTQQTRQPRSRALRNRR